MSGEQEHAKGAEGAARVKRWLESTTRAEVRWLNPHPIAVRKLTFKWATGTPFSFDLGGLLRGDDLDGQEFLVESKKYDLPRDQGTEYVAFLAKCYVAYQLQPNRCDNFMWITWAPFLVTNWRDLTSKEQVMEAVRRNRERVFAANEDGTFPEPDPQMAEEVAERLWLIVLSDRQEQNLVMRPHHLALIRQHETLEEAS